MRPDEVLPYMNSIVVMKTTTGSVTVTTPSGPKILAKPGMSYTIASGPAEVKSLLAYPTNLKTLLKSKMVSLVF